MVGVKSIIFSTAMVQALLTGKKTQTRLIFKGSTEHKKPYAPAYLERWKGHEGWKHICPHGKIGDLLYVREDFIWQVEWSTKGSCVSKSAPFLTYRANLQNPQLTKGWKQSILMPRDISRLTLKITDIRLERLSDISEDDAIAEGVYEDQVIIGSHCNGGRHTEVTGTRYFWGKSSEEYETASEAYQKLWEHLHGKESWNENPWVWVLDFNAYRINVDEYLKGKK